MQVNYLPDCVLTNIHIQYRHIFQVPDRDSKSCDHENIVLNELKERLNTQELKLDRIIEMLEKRVCPCKFINACNWQKLKGHFLKTKYVPDFDFSQKFHYFVQKLDFFNNLDKKKKQTLSCSKYQRSLPVGFKEFSLAVVLPYG